jgi:tRNA1Val (adenine37-N6)-methyltransferase
VELATRSGFHLSEVLRVRQTPAHGSFRSILHFTRFPSMPLEHELIIKDASDAYTPEFHELLKDYYLRF